MSDCRTSRQGIPTKLRSAALDKLQGIAMLAVSIAAVALALLGHGAIWVGLVNRLHATGFPRKVVKTVTLACYLGFFAIPCAVAARLLLDDSAVLAGRPQTLHWATAYAAFCAAYGTVHLPVWLTQRLVGARLPHGVRAVDNRVVDVAQQLGGPPASGLRTKVFSRVPFNQLWRLHLAQFEVQTPRLPAAVGELSICQLSDLHFSGRIAKSYYQEVVRQANALEADLVVLTGDICDYRRYLAWIPDTLGRLHARLGKFFILGNHDLRTRAIAELRAAMEAAGFVDLGGRHALLPEAGLVLAGNERPWFAPLPALDDVPPDAFRILLSHSPDQFEWARRQGFDLMLAGHTHGGQVRFPLVGAVVCPSWHGTRYASGFFHQAPTLLHVSRGTAGLFPYRLNCPPEVTRLVVRRGA